MRRGAVLVAVVALGACGGTPEEGAGGSTTTSTSSAATSTSSTPAEDPELAAAEAKALEFKDLLVEIATNPETPLEDLDTVARGQAAAQSKHSLAQLRASGVTAQGGYSYRDVESTRDADQPRPTVVVEACVDRSGYSVYGADGTVRSGAPFDTSLASFTVEQWGDTWYVTKEITEPAEC